MSNIKSDALESLATIAQNNINNVFVAAWAEAEKAGEASEDEAFVKEFVKNASKAMFKKGWLKSSVYDYIETSQILTEEEKTDFKLVLYVRLEDTASYAYAYGMDDGGIKEKIRSKCFTEVVKAYRKWLD